MNTPQKFRKKPVEIEAMQLTDETAAAVIEWVGLPSSHVFPAGENWVTGEVEDGYLVIPTLEGNMRANLGDWIIRGVKGEFYPCKPNIFAATYEVAS